MKELLHYSYYLIKLFSLSALASVLFVLGLLITSIEFVISYVNNKNIKAIHLIKLHNNRIVRKAEKGYDSISWSLNKQVKEEDIRLRNAIYKNECMNCKINDLYEIEQDMCRYEDYSPDAQTLLHHDKLEKEVDMFRAIIKEKNIDVKLMSHFWEEV